MAQCRLTRRRGCVTVAVLAIAVYAGTLRGGWLFDDHTAVRKNGDVLGTTTVVQLLHNDFWGAKVASPSSHKSWRPLTVLVWRATHALWSRAAARLAAALDGLPLEPPPALLHQLSTALKQDEGPHPLPFHALNVAMHAVCSVLVLSLARQLFGKLHATGAIHDRHHDASQRPELQALLTAVLFAVHPIHTEAVAGMVGLAELLCVAFGVPALLLYATAVEEGGRGDSSRPEGAAARHWLRVAGAGVLTLCAALTKEIGITLAGTMVLWDILLAPHMLPRRAPPPTRASGGAVAGAGPDASCAPLLADSTRKTPAGGTARLQVLRVAFMMGVAVFYLKLRTLLENSLPYASNFYERTLSTGFLHARYAALLLLPHPLVAEYGFDCIPLVTSWRDPRNALTLALYAGLLHAGLAARPWRLLAQLWRVALSAWRGREPAPWPAAAGDGSEQLAAARWRLLVVGGLVVAPFFPASNVLFYVGTTIGERLLYTPSIGFCCLAVALLPDGCLEACAALLPPSSAAAGGSRDKSAAQADSASTRGRRAAAILTALVLVAAAAKTVHRCEDWIDDRRLFAAAARDCPNSVKMRQTHGTFELHAKRPAVALQHFRHVQRVAAAGGLEGYCETDYLIGLAEWELNNTTAGLALLSSAIGCLDGDTAVNALTALNRIYAGLREQQPADLQPLLDWATVLARRDVLRVSDACTAAEAAAMVAAHAGDGSLADRAVGVCLRALQRRQEVEPQAYADAVTAQLVTCVNLRRQLYLAASNSTTLPPAPAHAHHHARKARPALPSAAQNATALTLALYKYVAEVDARHPACRTLAGGGHSKAEPTHQKLLAWADAPVSKDPWLQLEWGRALLAANSSQATLADASVHLHAAALMFVKAAGRLQAGQSTGAAWQAAHWGTPSLPPPAAPGTLALDGSGSLTALEAVQAAMLPLDAFLEAAAAAGSPAAAAAGANSSSTAQPAASSAAIEVAEAFCSMRELRCQVLARLAELLEEAADGEDDSMQHAAQGSAARAHRVCVAQLAGDARCSSERGPVAGAAAAATAPQRVCRGAALQPGREVQSSGDRCSQ